MCKVQAVAALLTNRTEENLWNAIVAYQGTEFKTFSGLPYTYKLKTGRNGELTRELWIDRCQKSKSLVWSSVMNAFEKVKDKTIQVDRPKSLGDIRGISYIYPIFLEFGLVEESRCEKRSITK